MAKSKVKKGVKSYDLRVWVEDDEGIKVTNKIKNETFREIFLMDWFVIKTNSTALRDKLFIALEKESQLYIPALPEATIKKVESKNRKIQPKNTNPTKRKKISNKYSE